MIEGKAGEGESLMRGISPPEELPAVIRDAVEELYRRACRVLGPVRFEWVHDGKDVWLVQLHRGATQSTETVLVPGNAGTWITFDVQTGLEALRGLVASVEPGVGLVVSGDVGLTSHVADVIRKSGVPARIAAGSNA